jgi:hypothetical protein
MTTPRNTSRIPITGIRLETVGCDGYLLGDLQIGTEKLHVEALRVHIGTPAEGSWEQAWHSTEQGKEQLKSAETKSYECSCDERFLELSQLSGEGTFTSQRLSGHEGEWVLYATPYMQ